MQRFHRPSGTIAAVRTLVIPMHRPGERCRDCGAPMLERQTTDGRKFPACFRFPECKGGAHLIIRRVRSLKQRAPHGPVRKTRHRIRCRAAKADM